MKRPLLQWDTGLALHVISEASQAQSGVSTGLNVELPTLVVAGREGARAFTVDDYLVAIDDGARRCRIWSAAMRGTTSSEVD